MTQLDDKELLEGFKTGGTETPDVLEGFTVEQSDNKSNSELLEGFSFEEPEVVKGLEEPDEPGIGGRIGSRFMGTDVDDPLEFQRLGTVMAGATVGGIAGTRTPTLPGPAGIFVNPLTGAFLGSAIGTGIGVVAPESVLKFGEDIGALEPGTQEKLGLSAQDLKTVLEGEILLDVATGGGFSILRGVGRATARGLSGVSKEGLAIAKASGERGIHLMPVQVGDRIIARGFVAVMGRFPLIGSKIRKRGQAAEKALEESLLGLRENIGPLRAFSDISETIFSDGRNLVKSVNNHFREKYGALWKQADEAGISVIPKETLSKADEILKTLSAQTPRTVGGEATSPGPSLQKIKTFIENEILPLREAGANKTIFAKQSLRQMDGLVSKIDQEIASLEPGQKRFTLSLFNQLRQAAQGDAVQNVRGVNADKIARGMKELDAEFSKVMSEIFETSTAKRFGSVRRRGLRAIEFDDTTRIPIDQLSNILIKLDSPQAMTELSKLVTPDTYKSIVARVLDSAVTDSINTKQAGRFFDPEVFAKRLGLNDKNGARRKAVSEMLKQSKTQLTIEDLDTYLDAARVISNLDMPNVSTFIARRATIGGIQSLINGVIPGLGLVSASSAIGAAAGAFVGIATFVGSGRLISAILSRPESIRAFRDVAKQEAALIFGKDGIKPSARKAWTALIRTGLQSMRAGLEDERRPDGPESDIDKLSRKSGVQTTLSELAKIAEDTIDALDKQIRELHE